MDLFYNFSVEENSFVMLITFLINLINLSITKIKIQKIKITIFKYFCLKEKTRVCINEEKKLV